MIVSNISSECSERFVTCRARVTWEDSQRAPFNLFARTARDFDDSFWPDPNAFLLGVILPAWQAHERRIRVDGEICSVLSTDVQAALRVLRFWYNDLRHAPPTIENWKRASKYPSGAAVSLLSCGIDSLATLRHNTLAVPPDHPLSIRTCISVIFSKTEAAATDEGDLGRLPAARRITDSLGVGLAPVWTNLWWLVNDGYFFDLKWHGAHFAAHAMLFSRDHSNAFIGSSFDGGTLMKPWGSSPLLDTYYSTGHFRIHHHGAGMTRLDKTALVANWPVGLDNLRVCQRDSTGKTNCGRCEKCIRVMTSLVALGKMSQCGCFPDRDVSPELLHLVREWGMIDTHWKLDWYTELIPLLSARGRLDLANLIEEFGRHFEGKVERPVQ